MRILIIGLLVCLVGCGCGRGYSEGDRSGTINKLSSKGLFMKSWEGELLLGGVKRSDSGSVANVWAFTIVDSRVVALAQKYQQSGDPVTAHYVQWMAGPVSMETDYELTSITPRPER